MIKQEANIMNIVLLYSGFNIFSMVQDNIPENIRFFIITWPDDNVPYNIIEHVEKVFYIENKTTITKLYRQLINTVGPIVKEKGNDNVYISISSDDYNLIAYKMRKYFNLNDYNKNYINYLDKLYFAERLREYKIRYPKTLKANTLIDESSKVEENFNKIKNNIGIPCILKPRIGHTSKDVYKINNKSDINNFLIKKKNLSSFILQELVSNLIIFQVDGIFFNNKILCLFITFDCSFTLEDHCSTRSNTKRVMFSLPVIEGMKLYERLKNMSYKVFRAIGGINGAFNFECFVSLTTDNIIPLEINRRVGGWYIPIYLKLSGYNIIHQDLMAHTGMRNYIYSNVSNDLIISFTVFKPDTADKILSLLKENIKELAKDVEIHVIPERSSVFVPENTAFKFDSFLFIKCNNLLLLQTIYKKAAKLLGLPLLPVEHIMQ